MDGTESTGGKVRFGVFEFDLQSLELRRQGQPVRLQQQPAKVLAYLVERAGRLATREEMAGHLWSGTHVDFDQGLNNAIRHLRSALGDSAESPVYIETVPRMGYRFIASVQRLVPAERQSSQTAQALPPTQAEAGPSQASDAGIRSQQDENRSAASAYGLKHGSEAAGTQPGLPSAEYGLTPQQDDPPTDARATSQGPSPSTPRRKGWIGLVLLAVLAAAGWWYLSGLAPDPARQSDVPLQTTGEEPVSSAAQDSYLNALQMLSSQDFGVRRQSVEAFERAVRLEPDSQPARFYWALSTWLTAGESSVRRDIALERLQEAMAIAPDSPRIQLLRAEVAFYHEWDLESARRYYQRALELGQGLKEVHQSYGYFLALLGEGREAKRHAELALDLDASSPDSHQIAGLIYLRGGEARKAIELCGRVHAISDGRQWAIDCLLGAHLALADTAGALQVLSDWLPSTDPSGEVVRRIDEAASDEEALQRHLRWRFHLLSEQLDWTPLGAPEQRIELSAFGELSSFGRLALAAVRGGGEEFAHRQLQRAHASRSPSFLRWVGSPAFQSAATTGEGLVDASPLNPGWAAPASERDR